MCRNLNSVQSRAKPWTSWKKDACAAVLQSGWRCHINRNRSEDVRFEPIGIEPRFSLLSGILIYKKNWPCGCGKHMQVIMDFGSCVIGSKVGNVFFWTVITLFQESSLSVPRDASPTTLKAFIFRRPSAVSTWGSLEGHGPMDAIATPVNGTCSNGEFEEKYTPVTGVRLADLRGWWLGWK